MTSCSRKVRLSYAGTSLFSKPVDWESVKTNPSSYPKQNQQAVEQWVGSRKGGKKRTDFSLRTRSGEIPLSIDASQVSEFHRFDKIYLAKAIGGDNRLREDTVFEKGIGIPLVGRIPHSGDGSMIPRRGLWMPITGALLPGTDQAVIKLIDPTVTSKFSFSNQCASFDLTTPLALDIQNRQKDLPRLKALFNYDKFMPRGGINRLFGFSAEKTPVILVHGVFSSSTTWNNTINELLADPMVRQNYEFWTYGYPSGAPIPYLAYGLREAVEVVVDYRSERGANQPVIVFGHSMGGLMTKSLTQHSGRKIWDQLFVVDPDALPVSEANRALWKNMFIFEPIPEINRVVFTATPHSGAIFASSKPGKLVESVIRLPEEIKYATRELTARHSNCLTPLGNQLFNDFPNSLHHMQLGSEMGKLFEGVSLNPNVKYHSYIGSKNGLDVPEEEMTDGIVQRSSASIPGVESERVYHSDHGVLKHPETIADMKRVLKRNLHSN